MHREIASMKMGIMALVLIGLLGSITGAHANDYPQGCVDCHVKSEGELDFRLNVLLKQIGHRWIKTLETVPDDCGRCHEPDDSPTLGELLHAIHYAVPQSNTYVTKYDGKCINCHEMDAKAGEARVKSGPTNW